MSKKLLETAYEELLAIAYAVVEPLYDRSRPLEEQRIKVDITPYSSLQLDLDPSDVMGLLGAIAGRTIDLGERVRHMDTIEIMMISMSQAFCLGAHYQRRLLEKRGEL